MSLTTAGLIDSGRGKGVTSHYSFSYDSALGSEEIAIMNEFIANAEGDFTLMQDWFSGANIPFTYPLEVHVNTSQSAGGDASWLSPSGFQMLFGSWSAVQIDPGSTAEARAPLSAPDLLRYLLVSEVTEMLMMSIDNGWFSDGSFWEGGDEGSMGEGLSRFLGALLLPLGSQATHPPSDFVVAPLWLNGDRANFVDQNLDVNRPGQITGCTTLYLWFLHEQLGYGITEIIRAGSPVNLSGVYKNLTGHDDGWTPFIELIERHYPSGTVYHPISDNLFPVANVGVVTGPRSIERGLGGAVVIELTETALTEITVSMHSSDPAILPVADFTIPVGGNSYTLKFQTTKSKLPFSATAVKLTATYAGESKTVTINVKAPEAQKLKATAPELTCGLSTTLEMTLDAASLDGPANVIVWSSDPTVIPPPNTVQLAQGALTKTFTVHSKNIAVPFSPKTVKITAMLGTSTASADIKVVPPTVAAITARPNSVVCGSEFWIDVILDQPSALGDVVVELRSDPPNFGGLPATLTIPATHLNARLRLRTPAAVPPFGSTQIQLYASHAGTTVSTGLALEPSVHDGVLQSLTLDPPGVRGGQATTVTAILANAVDTETSVGLQAATRWRALPGAEGLPPLPVVQLQPVLVIPRGALSASCQLVTEPEIDGGGDYEVAVLGSAFNIVPTGMSVTF